MKSRPWRQAALLVLLATLPAVSAVLLHPRAPAWNRETLGKGEIAVEKARAWPDVVWIDARSDAAFEKGHIPGAILLNEDRWNEHLLAFAMQFRPEQTLVVYCDSLECNASHAVAERLRKELGAEKVFVLKGGWQSWQKSK